MAFRQQPLEYVIETNYVVVRRKANTIPVVITVVSAQISGKVMTEEGLPLAGASVLVGGSGLVSQPMLPVLSFLVSRGI